MRRTFIASGVVAVVVASASPAPSATSTAPVRFACATTGEKLIAPPASSAAVCERFRASLMRAMRDRRAVIRVTLSFTKAGVASARVSQASGGRVFVHPDFNVAVSDRAIGPQVVDLLARDVARAIDAPGKAR